MEMKSLYDYLGHAAGSELGQQVATAARRAGVKGEMREVYHVTNKGDTVAGFLTEAELEHRIDLLAHYTRSVPVQINKWSN